MALDNECSAVPAGTPCVEEAAEAPPSGTTRFTNFTWNLVGQNFLTSDTQFIWGGPGKTIPNGSFQVTLTPYMANDSLTVTYSATDGGLTSAPVSTYTINVGP